MQFRPLRYDDIVKFDANAISTVRPIPDLVNSRVHILDDSRQAGIF